ncbi:DUF3795 domain-containing protein [bacterium]|nr:DUF3795 domain-containing protein [bacterium]
MDKIISMCGLICSDCPAYIATQKGVLSEREKVAKMWSEEYKTDIKTEDINCDGCTTKGGRLFNYPKICQIRNCGLDKGVENCSYCEDYYCENLSRLFDMAPKAKETLEGIRKGH